MEKKRGPVPKQENEKAIAVTTYAKKQRIIDLGKGDEKKGLKKAKDLAKAAIEGGEICQ